jgi:hypothetical protein
VFGVSVTLGVSTPERVAGAADCTAGADADWDGLGELPSSSVSNATPTAAASVTAAISTTVRSEAGRRERVRIAIRGWRPSRVVIGLPPGDRCVRVRCALADSPTNSQQAGHL